MNSNKEKVVVFYFDGQHVPGGVVAISFDYQLKIYSFPGDVKSQYGIASNIYEIVGNGHDEVINALAKNGYTDLSSLSVFFDHESGEIVRPLLQYPGGQVIQYIAYAPGSLISAGSTPDEARAGLGKAVKSITGSVTARPEHPGDELVSESPTASENTVQQPVEPIVPSVGKWKAGKIGQIDPSQVSKATPSKSGKKPK